MALTKEQVARFLWDHQGTLHGVWVDGDDGYPQGPVRHTAGALMPLIRAAEETLNMCECDCPDDQGPCGRCDLRAALREIKGGKP